MTAMRLARERRSMKVQELADKSGLGRNTIWRIEKGYGCDVYNIIAIADVLNISIDEYMGHRIGGLCDTGRRD